MSSDILLGIKFYRNNVLKKAEYSQAISGEQIPGNCFSSGDIGVLSKLAKNPNMSSSNLMRIFDACKSGINDYSPRGYVVFDALSYNPHTPPEILVMLAQSPTVRSGVAFNLNTPKETLQHLATDGKESVRYQVARNPNTPIETLQALSQDSDPLVKEEAIKNAQRQR